MDGYYTDEEENPTILPETDTGVVDNTAYVTLHNDFQGTSVTITQALDITHAAA